MQKLQDYWSERSSKQKITLVAAFAVTFLMIIGFAIFANRKPMALLYGGLDGAQAGSVVAAIDRAGVAYEIRGDAIWVDEAQRDRLRMDLAGQGLPSAGGAGYELLDGMSGFGTTSQMFDAAYWRAKEGELARTILTLPNVKSARVHLAVSSGRGYRREQTGTASVTITTNGTPISRNQARSLKFLVSSGVPGMTPDAVAVIDSATGVVQTDDNGAVSSDREDEMRRNVERILEPHVGIGNAIVQVHLDLATAQETLTEQRFDPKGRALISEEREETSDQSSNSDGGPVTAASNLPESGNASGDQSNSASTGTRSRANYEVSQVTREVLNKPGATRRLTVAVLVNGISQQTADGTTSIEPRSDEELAAIRELVASSVGFDEMRGDEITVKSMPFQSLPAEGTLAEGGGILSRLAINDLAKIGLIGLFAIALVMTVLRPILRQRAQGPAALDTTTPPADPAPDISVFQPGEAASDAGILPPPEMEFSSPSDDPVTRLKEMMKSRQNESLQILSGWLDDKGGSIR